MLCCALPGGRRFMTPKSGDDFTILWFYVVPLDANTTRIIDHAGELPGCCLPQQQRLHTHLSPGSHSHLSVLASHSCPPQSWVL